jgi:soluble lytic murein transglycosylase-like protein
MLSDRHIGFLATLLLSLLYPAFAKEAVYLKSGFSFEADSHMARNQTVIVQLGAGSLEFPSEAIDRIDVIRGEDVSAAASPNMNVAEPKAEEILNEAAYDQGLDKVFVYSVAKVESRLHQEALSSKGAVGLMQLMPGTAAELGVNPEHARDNASGGAKYLRSLLLRYKGNSMLALAAYNAGPGAVAKFHGIPPYPETRRYIRLVLEEYERQLKMRSKEERAAGLRPAVNKPSATN